ncbi:MAG: EcsC family protein [Pseudomonadota bacterium]|nr:EcsC family protein [Pseudomonadota bacterium]
MMNSTLALTFSSEDHESLKLAHQRLENPGFAIRASNLLGWPLEHVVRLLPETAYKEIYAAAQIGIRRALDTAVSTLNSKRPGRAGDRFHLWAGMGAGALGGSFGLAGLAAELPISTGIMLRSIADVAIREGEDLADLETRMACLEVFALGGYSPEDDAADAGYYGLRLTLAASVSRAATHISRHGMGKEGAPAIAALIGSISSRFGFAVSEKVAAQMVPVVGAAGGAAINWLFIKHFQKMAHAHFTMRRLERHYGETMVKAAYQTISESAG